MGLGVIFMRVLAIGKVIDGKAVITKVLKMEEEKYENPG